MSKENKRRLVLYPAALLVLSGLVYGGFVYEAEPDPFTLMNSAEILAKVGSHDAAIENAKRALLQIPDYQYGHIIIAHCYAQKGCFEDSLSYYRRAIELSAPDDENLGMLRLYYAETMLTAGKLEEAEKEALDVVRADPGRYQAWHVVARVRKETGRTEEAREACLAAKASAPDDPTPIVLLAAVEEEAGNVSAAASCMLQAVALSSGDPAICVRAARLLVADDRPEEAVKALTSIDAKARKRAWGLVRREKALAGLLEDERVRELFPVTAEKIEKRQKNGLKSPATECR